MNILLFAHAWGGCDTTSAIFKQGKIKILTSLLNDDLVQSKATIFGNLQCPQGDIGKDGNEIFIKAYKGKVDDTLISLRYAKFMESLSTCTSVNPATLPPTEAAAYYHALRVHLQVSQWKQLDLGCLLPTEWGWKLEGGVLVPHKTDLEPAPGSLLKCIRCSYKVSSKNTCGTNSCTCRKSGVKCVSACTDCRGQNCNNTVDVVEDDDENYHLKIYDI